MSKNKNLHKAKKEKNDEFYTLLSDIEKEMVWYKDFFKDKVVYCNCDDARESNFFKYFSENFELLGLKKLITTGYIPGGHGVVLEYSGDKNGDFMVGDDEISTRDLAGDGDFRSPECIEFLKQADVVVTNPPFSLFREYVAQLFAYNKKFIIIGSKGAIGYKEIFPKIKDNKLWLGPGFIAGNAYFKVGPGIDTSGFADGVYNSEDNTVKFRNCGWFTNVDFESRHDKLDLCKKYNATDYPKYDNYDAINVDKTSDIPEDYDGIMGVPITFLDKYNPDQFEIMGIADRLNSSGMRTKVYTKTDDPNYNDLNRSGAYYEGGKLKGTFTRIFIKRKS